MALLDLMAIVAWVVLAIAASLIVSTMMRKRTVSPDQAE